MTYAASVAGVTLPVAELLGYAGLDVVVSNSRGPQTLRPRRRLGGHARAATPAEAAQAGDLVVVTVPMNA
jgi:8-hydroxy-5-deazaflavin:NADPH oxidoreductase